MVEFDSRRPGERLQRDSLPVERGWKLASRINARIASGIFTVKGGQSRKVAGKMSNLSRVTLFLPRRVI